MDWTYYYNGFKVPIRNDLAQQNSRMDSRNPIYCLLHIFGGFLFFKTIFFWKITGIIYRRICSIWDILG